MNLNHQQILSGDEQSLFFLGGCHVFALALHARFGYPLALVRNEIQTPPKGAVHVFCRLGDVYAVDAKGTSKEQVLLRDCWWDSYPYSVQSVTLNELEEYFVQDELQGGLYANTEFMSRASVRANDRISKHLSHFNGMLLVEISGPPRCERHGAAVFSN